MEECYETAERKNWYVDVILPRLSSRRNKLLIVTKWCWPYGGGEEFLKESMEFLCDSWKWIGWLSFTDAHNEPHETFRVVSLPGYSSKVQHIFVPGGFSHALLAYWLRLLQPNCVHHQGPLQREILDACHQFNVPCVSGYHFWSSFVILDPTFGNCDIVEHIEEHRIDEEFVELYSKNLDVFYVASNFMNRVLEELSDERVVPLDVVQPIPLGFLQSAPQTSDFFGEVFMEIRPVDVLIVNMHPRKGGGLFGGLVRLFQESGVLLGIASETLNPSQSNKTWVETIVASTGYSATDLFDKRLFATYSDFIGSSARHGIVARTNDINSIYKNTRLLVVPSLVDETFCRVVLEAMSNDCAVLVSRQGNLNDLVSGPDRKILSLGSPPKNTATIAQWVSRIEQILHQDNFYLQLEATRRQRDLLFQRYAGDLFRLNVLFAKAQALRRRCVGFVCPWADQGLGIQTRSYVQLLQANLDVEVSVFSYAPYYAESAKHILQKNPEEWAICHVHYCSENRENISNTEFLNWIYERGIWIVFIPETVNARVFELAELATRNSVVAVAIPNIEIVKRREVRWHRKFDVVLGNSHFCLEQLKMAQLDVVEDWSVRTIGQPLGFYLGYSLPSVLPESVFKPRIPNSRTRLLLLGGMNAFSRKRAQEVLEVYAGLTADTLENFHLTLTIQHKLTEEQEQVVVDALSTIADPDALTVHLESMSYQRIAELYHESDCVLQLSKQEGLGLGFFEAISRGIPVITLNVPPHNEIIRDGVSGILLPSGCAGEMTDNADALYGSSTFNPQDLKVLLDDLATGQQTLPTQVLDDFNERYGFQGYIERWKRLLEIASCFYL